MSVITKIVHNNGNWSFLQSINQVNRNTTNPITCGMRHQKCMSITEYLYFIEKWHDLKGFPINSIFIS